MAGDTCVCVARCGIQQVACCADEKKCTLSVVYSTMIQ